MQQLGKLRRGRRNKLKADRCLEGMTKQQIVENKPKTCDDE